MDFTKLTYLTTVLLLLFGSCNNERATKRSHTMPPIFPDYKGVTIPPNIAPLNFEIEGARHLVATYHFEGDELFVAKGSNRIQIDANEWKKALDLAKGNVLTVTVSVWNDQNPEGIEYTSFPIYIASEAIDPYIAYRLIPPGYEEWKNMGIYQRCLSSFHEDAIVTNAQNNKGCVNCHSFCDYSPQKLMFHARGKNGGTVITSKNTLEKIELEALPGGKSGTYPYWHPSGRYIVFSSNTTRQSFYGHCRNKIEVYDLGSDLIIYDRKKKIVLSDPRFNEESQWETFPSFSPDGKSLYFCTAKAQEMPKNANLLKYSICRIGFNEDSGILSEQVDTLYSSTRRGGSASFPRISPNGRYLLYTEAECATFPIHHKEADLKMIDLKTKKEISTCALNSNDVDSYHSWSSNGRWILFSSKRIDGRYTRLFIAHVEKNGKFGKPFLLPQIKPEHNRLRFYSYNIPEFINNKVNLSKDAVADLFK
ncbi:MAG: hypothetical protein RR280_02715 [Bacteroidaceae bacterium]